MGIETGQCFPSATLVKMGDNGPETLELGAFLKGRTVVLFGLPGAFTGPCSTIHLPSFIKVADELRGMGVDEIACIAVNDPFTLKAWGDSTGATEAGITMLGDASGELTKTLGMDFTAPHIGLYGRSNRYAVLVKDGLVALANVDDPGVCKVSVGDELIAAMEAAVDNL